MRVTSVTAFATPAGEYEDMNARQLPDQWKSAWERDRAGKPAFPDPLPERRLARLLAAHVLSGLLFMILPGTVLGVWNLVGITSERQLSGVSAAWIQAHGHAQFFGWFGTLIIGISLYTLPKFRGATCRSIPAAWAVWALWNAGVALRWFAGVQTATHASWFAVSATLELSAVALFLWLVTAPGPKRRGRHAWELPILAGLAALMLVVGWQLWLSLQPMSAPALAAGPDAILISLAVWGFAFPVVTGYSAKLFPGLIGSTAAHGSGLAASMALAAAGAVGISLGSPGWSSAALLPAVALAAWSVRVFHPKKGKAKTTGVYAGYPRFVQLAYLWLFLSALLGFAVPRAGFLGASRHAFTVGFLVTLVFAIGPRILPSFLNSRELWSARLMRASLFLITAGCTLRVISEPLAYGNLVPLAWKVLPVSGFTELAAILLFGFNLLMSMATPVPSWFGRKHVNDRMSLYWLVASYPATRKLMVANGLITLSHAAAIPKSLTLREAAEADAVAPELLVGRLADFFEARLPRSLRQPLRTSESTRFTNR